MIQWKEAWNKNMEDEFSPSWVSALDESMMECINKYCPGFMCVGRNITILEMNVIQSVVHLTRFLFRALTVKVKDQPEEQRQKKYSELGRTVGVMLPMYETFYGTGKEVVMDSGFCVSRGIDELKREGVYGASLIKNKKYWPEGVPGAAIDANWGDAADV